MVLLTSHSRGAEDEEGLSEYPRRNIRVDV